MKPLTLLADQAIPFVEDLFADFCQVRRIAAAEIDCTSVVDVDILLVRTVTVVNEQLLSGSRIQYVGSCTAGYDHIDRNWLQQKQIRFGYAAGCNARAVAEYVLTAIFAVTDFTNSSVSLPPKIAVIGFGAVGRYLVQLLQLLPVELLIYDPPLAAHGIVPSIELESVLAADIITLHPALVGSGPYANYHMLSKSELLKIPDAALLINTSRGAVIDNVALEQVLSSGKSLSVILDVWEGEPDLATSLAQQASLTTPHIAGYSQLGKWQGTALVRDQIGAFFGWPKAKDQVFQEIESIIDLQGEPWNWALMGKVLLQQYDIWQDHIALQQLLNDPKEQRIERFKSLRNQYRLRQEFVNTRIVNFASRTDQVLWNQLGFTC